MKLKSRWMAALLSFVLLFSFCMGDMQTVQAKAKAKNLKLNYTSVTMQKGAKLTLRVTLVSPAGASKKVTWKSSNRKVVSVSKKGVITAKKKGTATITAKGKSGGKIVKCKVKVTDRKKPASKVLVAYFSATGTTKDIAKKVAKTTGGTLYRITPAKKYSSKDLNYNNDDSRANKEQNNKKARPSLKGKTVNMKDFDTVFIAYPIWWGDLPRVMSTFAESYDFSGKTVIPLCTSHSSGIGSSVNTLKKSCRGNVKWKPGRRFAGDESQTEITKWVNSLGVIKNDNTQQQDTEKTEENKVETNQIYIKVGKSTLTAVLEDNKSAKALKELLADGPLTISASNYGGFEKVCSLDRELPSNDSQMTTHAGDICLYNSSQIVIFYGSNSWAYTKLGKILDVDESELKEILSGKETEITLSLKE